MLTVVVVNREKGFGVGGCCAIEGDVEEGGGGGDAKVVQELEGERGTEEDGIPYV